MGVGWFENRRAICQAAGLDPLDVEKVFSTGQGARLFLSFHRYSILGPLLDESFTTSWSHFEAVNMQFEGRQTVNRVDFYKGHDRPFKIIEPLLTSTLASINRSDVVKGVVTVPATRRPAAAARRSSAPVQLHGLLNHTGLPQATSVKRPTSPIELEPNKVVRSAGLFNEEVLPVFVQPVQKQPEKQNHPDTVVQPDTPIALQPVRIEPEVPADKAVDVSAPIGQHQVLSSTERGSAVQLVTTVPVPAAPTVMWTPRFLLEGYDDPPLCQATRRKQTVPSGLAPTLAIRAPQTKKRIFGVNYDDYRFEKKRSKGFRGFEDYYGAAHELRVVRNVFGQWRLQAGQGRFLRDRRKLLDQMLQL